MNTDVTDINRRMSTSGKGVTSTSVYTHALEGTNPIAMPPDPQRSEVNPRMLDNKVESIEGEPLSDDPYWDWLLYPSEYPRW